MLIRNLLLELLNLAYFIESWGIIVQINSKLKCEKLNFANFHAKINEIL